MESKPIFWHLIIIIFQLFIFIKDWRLFNWSVCRNIFWYWLKTFFIFIKAFINFLLGASPDSENETKAIINAINAKLGDWIAYLNIHSYGNLWLTPFGNSTTVVPSNYNDLIAKGNIGADAIKAYSGNYFVWFKFLKKKII